MDRAADAICESLGIESHSVGKQTFLLDYLSGATQDLARAVPTAQAAIRYQITVTFLKGADEDAGDSLVRARTGHDGSTSFALSVANALPSGERIIQESALSPADAARLVKMQRDSSLRELTRERITFFHRGRVMMLDICKRNILLLRVERWPGAPPTSVDSLDLPNWMASLVKVSREVTNDPAYLYKAMAERKELRHDTNKLLS